MKTFLKTSAILMAIAVSPVHSDQTDEALELATRWQKENIKPIMGDDGRVLFAFGMSQPTVVCAPLKLCDIALELGEEVQAVKAGDSARWVLDGAVTGSDETRVEHIIIKPKQAGLENTLFIATNRRGYLISLVSDAEDNMGKVGFTYSDNLHNVIAVSDSNESSGIDALSSGRPVEDENSNISDVLTENDIQGHNLNFNYRVDVTAGKSKEIRWKPVRVYDDGIKTFIDMDSKNIRGRELPVLMVYDTNKQGSIINYRVQRGRYIVDGIFDHAGLVLGVGKKQTKVSITRSSGFASIDQPYGE